MKNYILSITAVLITVFVVGIGGPWLISQSSTELVLVGIALLVAYPVVIWWLIKPVYKHFIMKLKERKEDV